MTHALVDATRILAGANGNREAAGALLRETLVQLAGKVRPGASPAKRDEAVQQGLFKLLKRLTQRGELDAETDSTAKAYLRRVLESAFIDGERSQKRQAIDDATEPDSLSQAGTEDEEMERVLHEAAELASRVLEAAVARWPRSEGALREGFEQLVALASNTTTTKDLAAATQTNEATLFKRHERCRTKLHEMLELLLGAGEFTAQQAKLASGYISWLKRRKTEK